MARSSGSRTGRRAEHSSARYTRVVEDAVAAFGAEIRPLLTADIGEKEASLTSPMERLLGKVAAALCVTLRIHPQADYLHLHIKPDLAVEVDGATVGVVELKAPGRQIPGERGWGRGSQQTRKQWNGLSLLPNVLYTDGQKWGLYRYGERSEFTVLDGDVERAGARLRPADGRLARMLQAFLTESPAPPADLSQLIHRSAGLCHLLRDEVTDSLTAERRGRTQPFFTQHRADWQEWLFPDLDEAEFADAYAQTVTFGLLLARRAGVVFEGSEIPAIGEKLAKRHLLVGRALSILTARPDRGLSIEERSIVLQTMRRVIGAADWTDWPTTYHEMYEDFLEAYDPKLRRSTGAYYTPREVTDFIVRFVDEVLTDHLGIEAGFAADEVVALDPAMGTGSFLRSVIDRVAERATADGSDQPGVVRGLLRRLIGFERQIGPFSVAELKLDQALQSHNVEAGDRDMRLYVADTLGDPNKATLPARAHMYKPLSDSLHAANRVKTTEDVMVVLGNPPYRKHAMPFGRWVLAGRRGTSLLDGFRLPGNGRHEYKLHDMAIYFWRWALWKAFESTADGRGVVAFITTKAYLDGPGFAGMRDYLRRTADHGWIIDLSAEGHWSSVRTRVFPGVPHPVCVGVFVRTTHPAPDVPARIRYLGLSGTREEKYVRLTGIHPEHPAFRDCPSDGPAPLLPIQSATWSRHPLITDLLPYGTQGVKANRAWVHHPDPDVLKERWRELITAEADESVALLKTTDCRTIDTVVPDDVLETPQRTLRDETTLMPRLRRIGFRSFDRQYLVADRRVLDRPRLDLWRIGAPGQIFLITQGNEGVTSGLAVAFSALIPDTDFYKGHHGGRVIPMYRDAGHRFANLHPKLPALLSRLLKITVRKADVMPYVAGVVAHSRYTARFADELRQPGVRVPLTADAELWREAVAVGRQVIRLHTYGDWPSGGDVTKEHRPRVLSPVSSRPEDMPEAIGYDADARCLRFGTGAVGPVSEAAWRYEVSGMRIIKHWFDYRKRDPSGRRGGSRLDDITTTRWQNAMTEQLRDLVAVLEGCIALEPLQTDLLTRIVEGPLITTDDLTDHGILPPPPSSTRALPDDRGLF